MTGLPEVRDRRFTDPAWQSAPYDLISSSFLHNRQMLQDLAAVLPGTRHQKDILRFGTRLFFDAFAPSNFLATNPVLQRRIFETRGQSLADGAALLLEDTNRVLQGLPPVGSEAFAVGEAVATTPGRVVFRNALIELIEYAATTDKVRPEPILIVPAWIMKYYILDLSAQNSLVRYLVGQGYTVFMISWHNPDSADRDLDMDAYLQLGVMAALTAIQASTGTSAIHGAGYCIGGTLLSIAAAAMARDGDTRLMTLTLLAAQTDFSEPGDLGVFIDEAQLEMLDAEMADHGYLEAGQMAGAFTLLQSGDLIWSRIVGTYLMGERSPVSDLMAWNADGTRMPRAMHSQYLRRLFLHNDLAEGRYEVGAEPISLADLHQPLFVVGTANDQVAPWRSVYKIHDNTAAEIRFILTSGGHNAGIVSEPGHAGRSYRLLDRSAEDATLTPDEWIEHAEVRQGSWWIAWSAWLAEHSGGPVPSPMFDSKSSRLPADPAPGEYVMQR